MSDLPNIIKKSLLIGIFTILFLPLIQSLFSLVVIPPLKGDVSLPNNIDLTINTWISGEYQEKKEEYINDAFGFRSLFVRLNNQVAYSLFHKAKANGVIIGKDNYLFEEAYINAYTGKDFLGEDSISHTINRLKFISDTLNKLGKQLIIVFAAGKASYYPEFIPDSYLPINEKTNYKLLSSKSSEAGLNIIDFNKWFMDKKQSSKYPLYPKYGIHWSMYSNVFVSDSLIRKIEYLRGIDLPKLNITEVQMKKPFDQDYDIADGMNLLFKLKSFDMAYPITTIENSNAKHKPKVLVISDSFYWGLYNLGISNCFENSHFWYYNKQVFPESATKELLTSELNIGDELQKHEVIVILATEATLPKLGWGFIEDVEKYYKGTYTSHKINFEYLKNVKELVAAIKTNHQWLSDVKIRANEKGISLDSSLVLEAMWQIDNTKK